jgi:hypothetical protein
LEEKREKEGCTFRTAFVKITIDFSDWDNPAKFHQNAQVLWGEVMWQIHFKEGKEILGIGACVQWPFIWLHMLRRFLKNDPIRHVTTKPCRQ